MKQEIFAFTLFFLASIASQSSSAEKAVGNAVKAAEATSQLTTHQRLCCDVVNVDTCKTDINMKTNR